MYKTSAIESRVILLLAANPAETARLRLDQEERRIRASIERSRLRNRLQLESRQAVRQKDVRRAVLELRPAIVHFCGHGEGEEGLVLEGEDGTAHLVDAEALAGFFQNFAEYVRCIVLNACFSVAQAEAIARHIDFVIGMKSAIEDQAALGYAEAFYDALGAGSTLPEAHRIASNAPCWNSSSSSELTRLYARSDAMPYLLEEPSNQHDYRSSAPASDFFVSRPELNQLMAALTDRTDSGRSQGTQIALTTALRGAGGFGKTALAIAISSQEEVRRNFPNGILWVTFGQNLNESQRLNRVRDLLRWWSRREPPFYETLETASAALREQLSGEPVLLILDDIWLAADVEPFLGLKSPAALLMTTRNSRALPSAAENITVDALPLSNAMELLGFGLHPTPDSRDLKNLAQKLGEWPILLRLVNSQLKEEYRLGLKPEEALQSVEQVLIELGLTAFDRNDEEARELAIHRTVEASLQRLSALQHKQYCQLAIFQEDEKIPLSILRLLWGQGKGDVRRLCARLASMSLLYQFDPIGSWIQLHDVMRGYLLQDQEAQIAHAHQQFVDKCQKAESKLLGEDVKAYLAARLPYHLHGAGNIAELEELTFSYKWLLEKITRFGVNSAIDDLDLLSEDSDREALQRALGLSRSSLSRDPTQLASHLYGRLFGSPSPRIESLLQQAEQEHGAPWLRPVKASFQQPSGPILYSTDAHHEKVLAITQVDETRFATGSEDGCIHIWDFSSGQILQTLPTTKTTVNPARQLLISSSGHLVSGCEDGTVSLWDLEEERVVHVLGGATSPISVLCQQERHLIAGTQSGELLLWDLETWKQVGSFDGHSSAITGIGFLDRKTVISSSKDNTLRVWNFSSRWCKRTLRTPPLAAAEAMEVIGSREVVIGTLIGDIQVWRPLSRNTRPRRSVRYPSLGLEALCLVDRDLGISSVGGRSTIQIWNPLEATLGATIHNPGGEVTSLSKFGTSHLISGSKAGKISVWAIEELRSTMKGDARLPIFAIESLGDTTVAATSGSTLQIWNAKDGTLLRNLEGHTDTVNSICTSDDRRIISASSDNTIKVWDSSSGELLQSIECSESPGAIATFGGTLLIVAPLNAIRDKAPVRILILDQGKEVSALPQVPGVVATLTTLDARFIIAGTYEGHILHLDISTVTDRRNLILKGHERGVLSLAIFDEQYLASGSLDRTIRLWDLFKGEDYKVLTGHEMEVTGLAFISPQLLASTSMDHSLRIWDLARGRELLSVRLDTGLSSLALLPDRRTLVTGDSSGQLHFFRLENLTHQTFPSRRPRSSIKKPIK